MTETQATISIAVAVEEDKRTLCNAVRDNPQFAERWRNTVLDDWQAYDDHDPDSTGACNFRVVSMTEFRALIQVLHESKIRKWHLWFTIETEAIRASGGLGFRSDEDVMGDIRVDWKTLGDKTRLAVDEAIGILETVL